MAYEPPDFETARADQLAVYRNLIAEADTREGSEIYARASMNAGVIGLVSRSQHWVLDQAFPETAEMEFLLRHAANYNLSRLQPTRAVGVLQFTGLNGAPVPSGLICVHSDGTQYQTTGTGTVSFGLALVVAEAVETGSAGNRASGDTLTVQSPPLGIDGTCTIASDFIGGTDLESPAALLARIQARRVGGNAGGTTSNYEDWGAAVDGVVAAHAIPNRRGLGTVSVAVFTQGAGGYRAPASSTTRTAVETYIDGRRPVTATVDVPAVTEVFVTTEVTVLEYEAGYDEAAVRDAVSDAVTAFIYSLRTGGTLYRTQLGRAISSVPGVLDYDLVQPASDVTATADNSAVEVLSPNTPTVS